jgi:hypothetical protein
MPNRRHEGTHAPTRYPRSQKSKPRCTGFQNETFFWKATSFFQAPVRRSCDVTDFGPFWGCKSNTGTFWLGDLQK